MDIFNTQPQQPDMYDVASEKKALWHNASKLGLVMMTYYLFSKIMVYVYYYIVYLYKNHSLTLSFSKVAAYLQSKPKLITSSMFAMCGNLFCVITTFAATLLVGKFMLQIDFNSMLKPEKNHIKQAAVWFPACMTINTVMSVLAALLTFFLTSGGVRVPTVDFSLTKPGALVVILQISYVVIIGPIIEEILYRGVVLTLLMPYGKGLAIFVSALLFGLMHGNIPQAIAAVAGAVMYGLIAVKFNSIIPTILIHIANNLIASYPDYTTVYNLPGWIYYVVMIILAVIGMFVIFTRITELRITNEPQTLLTKGQKYRVVFTNIFMIIYILMLLSVFVKTFYYANM